MSPTVAGPDDALEQSVRELDLGTHVGAQGILRLMNLRLSLRTPGPDSIELPAKVSRHDPAGFAVQFTGPSAEVRTLIGRL